MEIATSKNVINRKLHLCICFSDESEILRLDWNQLFKMQQNLKKPLTEQNRFAGDPHWNVYTMWRDRPAKLAQNIQQIYIFKFKVNNILRLIR